MRVTQLDSRVAKTLAAGLLCGVALAVWPTVAQAQGSKTPWYGMEGFAGRASGKCITGPNAQDIYELSRAGMATIVSEQVSGGKVQVMTIRIQGHTSTIYRDKAVCQKQAQAMLRSQTTVPDKYK